MLLGSVQFKTLHYLGSAASTFMLFFKIKSLSSPLACLQASTVVVSAAVGTAALGAKYLLRAWGSFIANPRARKFYYGGFQQAMNRREAALILGVR